MAYKFRNKAANGQWLSFLLPFSLLPLTIKSQHVQSKLMLALITWLPLSQVIKKCIYGRKELAFELHWIFYSVLSIPISLIISMVISQDVINVYIISLIGVLCYNVMISKLLINCCGSFTLGEVQLIAQGIILYLFCAFNTCKKTLYILKIFMLHGNNSSGRNDEEAIDLLKLLVLGLFFLICFLYVFPKARKGIHFHLSCFSFAIFMIVIWCFYYQQNVITWLFEFCTDKPKRIYLFTFWLIFTIASVAFVVWINQRPGYTASTLDRKYFHIIANAIFISGIIYDTQFLLFASVIALGVFIILEVYRILDVPVIGKAIGQAFQIFLDEKDSGVLILTHIYLLVGCASPIWISSLYANTNEYHMSLLSGIISVGFGDTFAAIGGTLYGKHFWKGSKKTIEGTVFAIIAQLACSLFFMHIGYHFSLLNIVLVVASILLTSLLEAKTDQVDNLVLPLFMFSFLTWIH